ncbi:MAG: DegT/DnrJ/EryC1/StrS family aminotransferase, partial [Pseudomonadota bacterium]
DRKRISLEPGFNSRLDELQAAILRVKLKYLNENNQKRMGVARAYDQALSGSNLVPPWTASGATHVYHQYVVRCPDPPARKTLIDFMLKHHIQTAIHYPLPVHLQPAYRHRTRTIDSLLNTEVACRTILSLPMFPELTQAHLDHIVAALEDFLRKAK